MPNSVASNAPITVTYVTPDGLIARSFLMTKNKKVLTLEKPACSDIYAMLAGSFYAYDRQYPISFTNLLDFFDFSVLNKNNNSNRSSNFANFKAKYIDININSE